MGDRSRPEIFDSPGKKYPRLVLLFLAIVLFAIISWLPHLNDKNRGPLAFVWPENQTRSTRHLVRPDQVGQNPRALNDDSYKLLGDNSLETVESLQAWKQHKWIRAVSSGRRVQRCRELGGESSGERKRPEDHLNLFDALSGEGELGKGPVKSPWSASPFPCRPSGQQLKTGAAKTSSALFRF